MSFIMLCLVGFASYVIGVFGFSQIIGSLQSVRRRGAFFTIYTITLWVIILVLVYICVRNFFYRQRFGYYIAMVISFIQVNGAGKIE